MLVPEGPAPDRALALFALPSYCLQNLGRDRHADGERFAHADEYAADRHISGRRLRLWYAHGKGKELGVCRKNAGAHGARERLENSLVVSTEDLLSCHGSSFRGSARAA